MTRHKHDWILVDKTVTESPVVQLAKLGLNKFSTGSGPEVLVRGSVVHLFKCKGCDKIRVERTMT